MIRFFLSIALLPALASGALADTICREPDMLQFGSSVSSRSSNTFLITSDCNEDSLVVRKPVSLAVHFGQTNSPAVEAGPLSSASWTILFGLDRDDLDEAARGILDRIPVTAKVRVLGYTCPIGSEGYNLGLSRERAMHVASYLRNREVSILHVEGRGECCPVSDSDLSKNRRVLIVEDTN